MDQVLGYLRKNKSRFVDELRDYVSIPSVSAQPHHKADMTRAAQWLAEKCQEAGLQPEIIPTKGHSIVLARTPKRPGKRPHFVVYGHYDVQPAEPFELWKAPPFSPQVKGGFMYGRGASDNKGQHLAHLKAVEAYLKTGTELPVDLTFLIEGEEEVGSANLATFLQKYKRDLACEAIVISDTGIPSLDQPALTYALRGIMAFELMVYGPSRDLHSGIFGGAVLNPAVALAQMVAKVHNANGKVTIPGFYDGVLPLTRLQRNELAKLRFDSNEFRDFLGVPELFGEKGFTPNEQRTARPTFEINGLTSGYQGEGSKTIVPSWARAKITCRLVANQRPEKIRKAVISFFKKICPKGVRLEVAAGHGGEAYLMEPTKPLALAALRAVQEAFEAEPVLLREGGSIPIVNEFKNILKVDTLLIGLALPADNAHSPNERFSLECFAKGMQMGAHLWQELPKAVNI